jgi:Nucleoside-diphosphate-sugar epimerases
MSSAKVVLLTGATGFVGQHLARHMLAEGWQVHAVARPSSAAERRTSLATVQWHLHDGDTSGLIAIMAAIRPQVVIHLAARFIAEHTSDDVDELIRSNILFGTQLLEAMAANEIRHLINTGTSWQHYNNEAYNPVCLYAATKQAFESLARYYVEVRRITVTNLVLTDTYGPDDPRKKLFWALRDSAHTGRELSMSPGEQFIDLVYIDDVVKAYMMAVDRMLGGSGSGMEYFGVSSGCAMPLRDLVAKYAQVTGLTPNVKWGGRPYRGREMFRPWSGVAGLPGWAAAVPLEEGLCRMEGVHVAGTSRQ